MSGLHPEGFITEPDIETYFKRLKPIPKATAAAFGKWYKAGDVHPFTYGHHDTIGGGHFTCDTITDEWFRWFLTTPVSENAMTNPRGDPYNSTNAALMDKQETFVYFAAASPFQEPHDFKRIIMTRKAPLLVPIYNMVASVQEHPSVLHDPKKIETHLTNIVKEDLAGIIGDTVQASFDGESFYGCCVIREKVLKITNVPDNNVLWIPQDRLRENNSTIELCHGGFWLLIKEEKFTPGDHLLKFTAQSKNYEMQAKLLITVVY